jgi:Zn-dependent protease
MQLPAIESCPQCGTQLAPTMLACPRCARLVHADRLASLAQSAREAEAGGDVSQALAAWREALALLPAGSKQHQVIAAKITELGQKIPLSATPTTAAGGKKSPAAVIATSLGAAGLMLWKLKALLLGLTKGSTLFSMLLSLGVYWTVWGWKFALGLVLSIYVHEMGHVIALRRYGFKATAPMFIPGLGALIRLKQQVVNPQEDADIGLAGPIYGLGAALVALGLWLATAEPIFAAIAGVGAWLNLLNLIPISPLDGGRGFHAMSARQKLLATATVGAAYYFTGDGLLILIGLVGVLRVLATKPGQEGSRKSTLVYCLLVAALSAVAMVRAQSGVS